MDHRTGHGTAEAHDKRGSTLYKQGHVADARKEWHRAIEIDPDYLEAHFHLAEALRQHWDLASAEDEYREMLRIAPGNADGHRGLGDIYDELSDFDSAICEYQESLRMAPGNDQVRMDLTWVLIEAGRPSEAEMELGKLTDASIDETPLWVDIGEAHEKQGDRAAAIHAYRHALDLNPDSDAREALGRLGHGVDRDLPPTTQQTWLRKGGIAAVALGVFVAIAAAVGFSDRLIPWVAHLPSYAQEHRVVLRSNRALTPDELSKSAGIFSARLKAIGVSARNIATQAPSTIEVRLAMDDEVGREVWATSTEDQFLEFVDTGRISPPDGSVLVTSGADTVVGPGTPVPAFAATSASGAKVYRTLLTNRDFRDASLAFNPTTHQPYVLFALTGRGSAIFADHTAHHIGEHLTIVLNKHVISAPVIKSQIKDGSGIIEGKFTLAEAQRLVIQLNGRPLPAEFSVVVDDVTLPF